MNIKLLTLFIVAGLTFVGSGCNASPRESLVNSSDLLVDNMKFTYQGELPADQIENKLIRLKTSKGDIVFKLFPEKAPIHVSNIIYLAKGGFYNGLTFHRREEGFVIQGGDPNGNGSGGPGYNIPAEFNDLHHARGMVAMARSMDPDSAGSQFYITLDDAGFLDGNYTVFGEVIEGMDVVDKIRVGDVMNEVVVEQVNP